MTNKTLYRVAFRHECIVIERYLVIKETDKSFIIEWLLNKTEIKIISKTSKKAFARETKKKALEDFIAKRKSRIEILKRLLDITEYQLKIAEGYKIPETKLIEYNGEIYEM